MPCLGNHQRNWIELVSIFSSSIFHGCHVLYWGYHKSKSDTSGMLGRCRLYANGPVFSLSLSSKMTFLAHLGHAPFPTWWYLTHALFSSVPPFRWHACLLTCLFPLTFPSSGKLRRMGTLWDAWVFLSGCLAAVELLLSCLPVFLRIHERVSCLGSKICISVLFLVSLVFRLYLSWFQRQTDLAVLTSQFFSRQF